MIEVKETQREADKSMNIPKTTVLYTLSEWTVWYVNYISTKLFLKRGRGRDAEAPRDKCGRKPSPSLSLLGQERKTVLSEPVWDKDPEEALPARAAVIEGSSHCPNSSSEAEKVGGGGREIAQPFSSPAPQSTDASPGPNSALSQSLRQPGWCLHTHQLSRAQSRSTNGR